MSSPDLVTIALTGVTAYGRHGVFDAERQAGQPFVVDVTLRVRRPDSADDLVTTVDYGAVANRVVEWISGEPVDLIETLASRMADDLVGHPSVVEATVTVHKPQAPISVPFADVSVTVTRRGPA